MNLFRRSLPRVFRRSSAGLPRCRRNARFQNWPKSFPCSLYILFEGVWFRPSYIYIYIYILERSGVNSLDAPKDLHWIHPKISTHLPALVYSQTLQKRIMYCVLHMQTWFRPLIEFPLEALVSYWDSSKSVGLHCRIQHKLVFGRTIFYPHACPREPYKCWFDRKRVCPVFYNAKQHFFEESQ